MKRTNIGFIGAGNMASALISGLIGDGYSNSHIFASSPEDDHLERLKKFGPCQIHRKSFRPVFESLSFREKVYYVVSHISKGQVMTYQQLAQRIGHPQAWRAVGSVLNKNADPKIPCHRVIRSNGQLGGYNRGIKIKQELLNKEGYKR